MTIQVLDIFVVMPLTWTKRCRGKIQVLYSLVGCLTGVEGWHTYPADALFGLNLKCGFGKDLVHFGGRVSTMPEFAMNMGMSSVVTLMTTDK
jgi:hypothetical protein